MEQLRAATRGSPLALCQTRIVADTLVGGSMELEVEPVIIATEGDKKATAPIAEIGGKAVFAAALEEALLDGRVDIAVHSAKDLSAQMPSGLAIGAVLKRADPRDVLVGASSLENLAEGSVVGTGSARRKAQLAKIRPDLGFYEIRGNIETRLNKVKSSNGEGVVDAVVIAKAALQRLDIELNQDFCILETQEMIPQVGQGFLAVQFLKSNDAVAQILEEINDADSYNLLAAERGFLVELNGDCNIPAAAYAQNFENETEIAQSNKIQISGMLVTDQPEDTSSPTLKTATFESMPDELPAQLGSRLAQHLLTA